MNRRMTIAPLRDGDEARPVAGMSGGRVSTVRPRKAKASAIGRGRCKADGPLWAPDASDHAAARTVGGARIGCPREEISTMIIAAPQCGQTEVGAATATDA